MAVTSVVKYSINGEVYRGYKGTDEFNNMLRSAMVYAESWVINEEGCVVAYFDCHDDAEVCNRALEALDGHFYALITSRGQPEFHFTIGLVGSGATKEEAWESAIRSLSRDIKDAEWSGDYEPLYIAVIENATEVK